MAVTTALTSEEVISGKHGIERISEVAARDLGMWWFAFLLGNPG
jgi:hypothetical protein